MKLQSPIPRKRAKRGSNKRSPPRFAMMSRLKVRRILVPTDFSAAACRAVRYAKPVAQRFGAETVLLHVVSPLMYEADYGYGPVTRCIPQEEQILLAKKRLQSLRRRQKGSKATCLVRTGNAAEEIARAARDLKSDLIVMGEGLLKRSGGEKTVAESTLHNAPCPVLIVRENGAELLKSGKENKWQPLHNWRQQRKAKPEGEAT